MLMMGRFGMRDGGKGVILVWEYSIQELIKNELCLPLGLSRIADQSTCRISIHA